MAHTPGPWKRIPDSNDIISDSKILPNRFICKVLESTIKSTQKPVFIADDKELIDNARLIAAAPELLEACKYALTHLHPSGNIQNDFWGHNAIATLSKAIHKAEGKN